MTQNLLPGLLSDSTEFFIHDNKLKAIQNGSVKNFNELHFTTIQTLQEAIDADAPAQLALMQMHPDSGIKRIEQFARCRFGGLDFQADIKEGVLQDGEYWPCPLHGTCSHEGILCKLPVINGERLSKIEVQLIRESTTDKKNEVIADDLNLALGTFHALKNTIHKKTGAYTKQGLTQIAVFFNLIWT